MPEIWNTDYPELQNCERYRILLSRPFMQLLYPWAKILKLTLAFLVLFETLGFFLPNSCIISGTVVHAFNHSEEPA
jgi:hypothetical protein